ncbi:short-chain dehydrogenase [Aeromicrobium sp. Root495]|uniref:SDR family oxidoreductase n=1 Tax=Aeromicrobium sp. Root495 TaxID=1736550 RepID=UPI0006F722D0|nr:SDR family oxidoreductase [Aeromicrobium sp. Root495]KQY58280.1 short-chain dehydrogenase [Aeromicrobium sp. Root495]
MTHHPFDGSVTVITGAGSGIGRATALLAAQRGATLVLTDVVPDTLAETVRLVEAAGGTVAHFETFDITDAEAVKAFAAHAHERTGPARVVMNIAGISTWGRIQDLTTEHWQRTVDIDLMGPIHVMSAFVPGMIEAGRGGHVVNVSSAAGLLGLPLHAPYSAAKFGLRGVSEVLRFDLEQHDIAVTLVCPGAVDTPLVGTVDIVGVDRDDPKVARSVAKFQKHAVTPEQAAHSIVRGVERGKYLVFTSRDVWIGHLAQRYVPFGYAFAMRRLNRVASRLLTRATTQPSSVDA